MVMGAASFMSRWQQVGPAANVSRYAHMSAPESEAIVSWLACLDRLLHIRCSSKPTAPQRHSHCLQPSLLVIIMSVVWTLCITVMLKYGMRLPR